MISDSHVKCELVKLQGVNKDHVEEEISTEEQRYISKSQDRRSLDSTVTESNSEIVHGPSGCCVQTAKEMACIREKLLEIETKQSNLLDLLQVTALSFVNVFFRGGKMGGITGQKGFGLKWSFLSMGRNGPS